MRLASDTQAELWSPFMRPEMHAPRSIEPYRWAGRVVIDVVHRLETEIAPDAAGLELLDALRRGGLDPDKMDSFGLSRSRLYEVFQHADHPPKEDSDATGYDLPDSAPLLTQRRMIMLASECSFIPIAQGFAVAFLASPIDDVWIDLHSALTLIWYWGVDEEPLLARSLGASLVDGDNVHLFGPFMRLFELTLQRHVRDDVVRTRLSERFATQAALALTRIRGDDVLPISTSLMRPVLAIARENNLVAPVRNDELERDELMKAYARFATSVALGECDPSAAREIEEQLQRLQLLLIAK